MGNGPSPSGLATPIGAYSPSQVSTMIISTGRPSIVSVKLTDSVLIVLLSHHRHDL